MLFDLSDVLSTEGKVISREIRPEVDSISYMGNSYEMKRLDPFTVTVANIGVGSARVTGEFDSCLVIPCDRCLKDVDVNIHVSFERDVEDCKGGERSTEDENVDVLEGNNLVVETLINNEIFMNLPDKVLCRPDCKGFCPKCGSNLNERDCGCDTFVPDPRMAAIKDIFNAKREV